MWWYLSFAVLALLLAEMLVLAWPQVKPMLAGATTAPPPAPRTFVTQPASA